VLLILLLIHTKKNKDNIELVEKIEETLKYFSHPIPYSSKPDIISLKEICLRKILNQQIAFEAKDFPLDLYETILNDRKKCDKCSLYHFQSYETLRFVRNSDFNIELPKIYSLCSETCFKITNEIK